MSPSTLYTVGGTVHVNSSALYIRRNADEELMALCRAGTFAYVLTARQLGKSSLMVQTAYTLSKEGCCCASVDLTILGTHSTSASEWYLSLLEHLEEELELSTDTLEWWEDHAHLAVSYRFIKFFKEVVMSDVMTSVVIFFDEIDSTLKLPFSDDFFAAIRALYNARAQEPELKRLTFVLIGLATPSDLITDPQRTPFNIGQRVELTDFTAQEAAPLAKGLNLSPDWAPSVLNQVLKWTNGHPYLTQRLCEALANHPEPIHSPSAVDQLVSLTLLGEEGMKDSNLQFVHNMLTIRADDQIAVLATYRDIRTGWIPIRNEKHSRIHTHLKLSGVVRQQGKILQVRNPIYEEVFNKQWIKEQWPLNWWETLSLGTKFGIISTIITVSALFLVFFVVTQQQKTEAAQKQTSYALATAEVAIAQQSEARTAAEAARLRAEMAEKQERQARATAVAALLTAEAAEEVALAEAETSAEMALIAQSELLVKNIQFNYSGNPDLALLFVLRANLINVESKSLEVSKALSWIVEETQALRHVLPPLSESDAIQSVQWHPDGKQVLIGGNNDQNFYIWDGTTDQLDDLPDYNGHIWQAKWDQDQLQLLITDENGEITILNHEDQNLLYSTHLLKSEEIESSTLLTESKPHFFLEEVQIDKLPAFEDLSMPIESIKWSPNQQNVLIYYQNEMIKIWNASNNQFTDLPNELFSAMTLVEWHPNGQELLIGRDNGEVLTFNVQTEEETFLPRDFDSAIRSVVWSHDGHSVVIGRDDGSSQIWDRIASRDKVTTFKEDSNAPIRAIAWHPDEEQLATGDEEGKIRIWHRNGSLLKSVSGHSAAITALQWHPDGQDVITGSEDGTVRIWDATIDQRTLSRSASSAPETNSKLSNESTATGNEAFEDQSASTEQINCDSSVDFDKLSASLWSTTWNFIGPQTLTTGNETCAKIWNVSNGTLQSTFDAYRNNIWATAWSLDGDYLLTSNIFTYRTSVWNVATGDHVRSLLSGDGNHFAYSAAWHPSTKQVLTGGLGGQLGSDAHIWDAITGEKIQTFAKKGITSTISAVAWHPNGEQIVTGHWDGGVHTWDVATGAHLQAFKGHLKIVWSIAWRADGQQIATGSKDHTIRIWNAETGQLEQALKGHRGTVLSLAWHPDRNARPQLLTGSNDNIAKLWDTSTGRVLDTIRHSDNVVSVAWSPDGQQFLTASSNREIKIRVADDSLLMAKLIESVCKVWAHDELAIKSQIEDWRGCGRELALVADKIERYNTLRGLE